MVFRAVSFISAAEAATVLPTFGGEAVDGFEREGVVSKEVGGVGGIEACVGTRTGFLEIREKFCRRAVEEGVKAVEEGVREFCKGGGCCCRRMCSLGGGFSVSVLTGWERFESAVLCGVFNDDIITSLLALPSANGAVLVLNAVLRSGSPVC